MTLDPVIEELRDHGQRIAEECGGDVGRMAQRFRTEQAQGGRRVVAHKNHVAPSDETRSRTNPTYQQPENEARPEPGER